MSVTTFIGLASIALFGGGISLLVTSPSDLCFQNRITLASILWIISFYLAVATVRRATAEGKYQSPPDDFLVALFKRIKRWWYWKTKK